MMDDLDRAKETERKFRDAALKAQLNKGEKRNQLIMDGVVVCRGCHDPIPEGRLKMLPDADLCVECKQLEELKERR